MDTRSSKTGFQILICVWNLIKVSLSSESEKSLFFVADWVYI